MQNHPIETLCRRFVSKTDYFVYKRDKKRVKAYRVISKDALPLFLRGGDVISEHAIATGVYEPEVKSIIDYFALHGFNGYLIDIGANIGLTSCQSGFKFQEVHMYEPNPDCVSILRINAKIALSKTQYFVYEYGLGSKQEQLALYVPHGNWGGAFIKSTDNQYDDGLLSYKDGFGPFNPSNYDISSVAVESAVDRLRENFANLAKNGLKLGVIKIDVEGYEALILRALALTIPPDFSACVIFENWLADAALPALSEQDTERFKFFRLLKNKNSRPRLPTWMNSLFNFFNSGFDVMLEPVAGRMGAATYILAISPCS